MAHIRQIAAMHADSMGFIHIIGNRHQRRHRTKRHALEIHIETRTDDADAAIRQLLAYLDDTHIEELRLIDSHHINVIDHQQDILAAVHRRGLDHIAVVRNDILVTIPHVDGWFIDLHAQFSELRAFHTTDEFLGFTGEHRSAYYLDGTLPQTWSFGVSFRKHSFSFYLRLQSYYKKMTYTRVYATFYKFSFQFVRIEKDGDGAIVDEFHLHVGAEAAGFDMEAVLGSEAVIKLVIQRRSLLRASGIDERRTVTFAAIGIERELGYTEDCSAYIADSEVHLPLLVLEHTQLRDLLR